MREIDLERLQFATFSKADGLKTRFLQFAEEYCERWDDDDPDWLRQVAGDVQFVAEKLDVNVDRFADPLYFRAEEIEAERARYEPDDDQGWQSSQTYTDDADSMFQSLLYELNT